MHSLHFFSINIRSLSNLNISLLMNVVSNTCSSLNPPNPSNSSYPDNCVIAVQETWWSEHRDIKPFVTHSLNRNNRGGGVAIVTSPNLRISSREDLNRRDTNLEAVAIELDDFGTIVISYYCNKPTNQLVSYLNDILPPIRRSNKDVILLGDANARHHWWGSSYDSSVGSQLVNSLIQHRLRVYNTDFPTHFYALSQTEDAIDVCFGTIDNLKAQPINHSISDHTLIHIPWKFDHPLVDPNVQHQSTHKINDAEGWKKFQQLLSNDNSIIPLIEDNNLEDSATAFGVSIIQAYREAASLTVPKPRKNHWINKQLLKQIRLKNQLFKKFKNYPSDENYRKFKQQRNLVQKSVKIQKQNSWNQFMNKLRTSTNAKEAWSIFSRSRGEATVKAAPLFPNNTDLTKAVVLNNYFSQMGTPQEEQKYPVFYPFLDRNFDEISISETQLKLLISCLPNNKAPGADEITNEMIKHLPPHSIQLLTRIFNLSLSTGKFPAIWKRAIINPVPKKRTPRGPQDYRPISLLSNLGKLLEKAVTNMLTAEATEKKILSPHQFGFRSHTSCTHALLRFTTSVHRYIHVRGKRGVSAVLLDLKAAYDSVNRTNLVHILSEYNFSPPLINWVHDYMSNRGSSTKISLPNQKFFSSPEIPFTRGVPQGSPLSPILFNIYINNVAKVIEDTIPHNLDIRFQLYADDIIIWGQHPQRHIIKRALQHILDRVNDFMLQNELQINPNKCQSIGFGRTPSLHHHWHNIQYNIQGGLIPQDPKPKYLGIYLDGQMNWSNQMKELTTKLHHRSLMLSRVASTTHGASTGQLALFYKAYFRPTLEYGLVTWLYHVTSKTLLHKLQTIDNSAKRTVLGAINSTPISAMEVELQCEPLGLRAERLLSNFLSSTFTHSKQYLIELLSLNPDGLMYNNIHNLLRRLNLDPSDPYPPPRPINKLQIKANIYAKWMQQREHDDKGKHHHAVCPFPASKPLHWKLTNISRSTQISITRLRLGHAYTNHHKNRLLDGSASPICRLCNTHIESIEHLLTQCPSLTSIHTKIRASFLKYHPNLSPIDIDYTLILGREPDLYKIKKKARIEVIRLLVELIHFLRTKQIFL